MDAYVPHILENREFVELEEEDIQRLTRTEAVKFDHNPEMKQVIQSVETELGTPGHWEEHWLTVDASGRRIYARIYYTETKGLAVTSDGRIVRELSYPAPAENKS